MKLIANADDYGYSRAVNFGIIDAYQMGIVRSTTLMVNMPGFSHAVALAKENPGLGVGIHLTLTCGRALTGVSSLTDAEGRFLSQHVLREADIKADDITREYEAQWAYALEAGLSPTHLDSHHHSHTVPTILPAFLRLADALKMPVRLPSRELLPAQYAHLRSPEVFSVDFFDKTATVDDLKSILKRYENLTGILELMCHPAYLDQSILNGSTYAMPRVRELEVLCDPEILAYVREHDVELVSFKSV